MVHKTKHTNEKYFGIVSMVTDRLDMRKALNETAFRQAGYFTAAQARAAGYSAQSQKYHTDRGSWTRIERGMYRLAEWPSNDFDSYTRWFVWSEGAGVISHDSAAEVYSIGDLNPRQVHLTLPVVRRTRFTGVTLHHTALPALDVTVHGAVRVTTPERTILDLADSPITQEQFTELVEDSLADGLASPARLAARSDDFGHRAALRIERALQSARSKQA